MLILLSAATAVCLGSLAAGFIARRRLLRSRPSGWPARARRGRRLTWAGAIVTDRGVAGLAIWLMLLDAVLALTAPWPLKIVVDYGLGHSRLPPWLRSLHTLSPVGLAVAAALAGLLLLAIGGLAGYLATVLSGAIGERMSSRMRVSLVDHLLRASPRATSGFPLGELSSRLTSDTNRVSDTVIAALETLVPDLAILVGMTAITALLDWRLTLLVLGVIPLYAMVARLRNRRLRPAQLNARTRFGELSAQGTDLLARMPAVHVFGRADAEVEAYERVSAAAAEGSVTALDASARFAPLTDFLPGIGLAAALIGGTIEIAAGRLTVGGLLVFLAYLSSLTGPVRSLAQLSTTVTRGAVSRERLSELHVLPVLELDRRAAGAISPRAAMVELSAVSYAHRAGQPVLDQVSMDVAAGEFVCITGPSGTGKSTLLSLLVRLADPDAGRIRIAGRDVAGMPLERLRRLVTLVPQDPWLHRGSIAANIGYASPRARREQIEAAAELAGVMPFATRLPAGLDTEVGEHGRLLSGGQQRRIAVARALAAGSPVLLLDEPTTGLDPAAEEQLIAGLLDRAAGRTILLVTHSQRLAALADRVLRLDHGRLDDTATPGRVTAREGDRAGPLAPVGG